MCTVAVPLFSLLQLACTYRPKTVGGHGRMMDVECMLILEVFKRDTAQMLAISNK